MKAPNLIVAAVMLFTALGSCHRYSGYLTTISTNNNHNYKRVEYTGRIVFSADKNSIESMSPGSYLQFNANGEKLIAESDNKGVITYELFGNKTTRLNTEGKQILGKAIEMISEQQAKQKPNRN